ncbi:pseudouridine synthase Rsu [Thermoanaerobacterium xylanolyticum LX-11]|uniref:Pseudouridine synthase n=1 Tax=Thermoanaerobacterium xylanolyticum (strain ATCC 49914 / DSM 7097 / LX-11) TaxID=858215 RepID=F6BLE8_THEXL|nr:pseudouridine synthase [Thermoanaerobacterium xylanolyticum]AEF16124.1 pseudouridine synthase Rsu [Thermoanaerobacterium xylanolyticum LX-11]
MSKMRIDKLLSNMGYGSRKEIKNFIKECLVAINDVIIDDPGFTVQPDKDVITFRNEKVSYKEYIYIMMNKPKGVICATYDPSERTVVDLLPHHIKSRKVFPAGRLDKDTEGLLLITNDGELSHKLLSPKKHVFKKYYAEVLGFIDEDDASLFSEGILLDDGYKTMPATLEIISSGNISKVYISIREGKYHQIKRMFEAIDSKVIYLKRLSIGKLKLDENLKEGEWRELNEEEIKLLKSIE